MGWMEINKKESTTYLKGWTEINKNKSLTYSMGWMEINKRKTQHSHTTCGGWK